MGDRLVAEGVIDQRCSCDAPATWVRDDDTLFCDHCMEEDQSGLQWYRLKRRWLIVGGYDGARHALFARGPWLDPGSSTPTEVMAVTDSEPAQRIEAVIEVAQRAEDAERELAASEPGDTPASVYVARGRLEMAQHLRELLEQKLPG